MSEYVKIKRKLYDELIETQAKYTVLCNMLESTVKVYQEKAKVNLEWWNAPYKAESEE